ncbi:hypothetical protein D5R93_05705 [Actinomyces lilanjuaniae]|uniref:Uncharacterized protein n=1 Tax=Actinomyces lilanjuaniae TaxID=2321394 RepID=A0ABN5PMX4_9ACTO|nr:hypothetical protein [Actinomyces lilanjuaniae]AYD89667.1 hypothetical protein D5R93_05705 [Actinomyces lilanjuaniae]
MDLAASARDHRWRQIIDLVHQLPPESRTWDAMVRDPQVSEEIAAMMLAAQDSDDTSDEQRPRGLSLREWTPEVAAVAALYDLVAALAGARKVRFPHPVSLVDEAMTRQQVASLEDVIAQMTPHALASR